MPILKGYPSISHYHSKTKFKCDSSTKQSKYSNCTVNLSKYHHSQAYLIHRPDTIINACDPMQNPSQTCKLGQTPLDP